MNDKRQIRCDGREWGEQSIDKLYQLRTSGDIDHTAEFLSKKTNQWLPVAGILGDMEGATTTAEKVKEMKAVGFKRVRFDHARTDDYCQSCSDIAGKVYPIDEVPAVPPKDCTCNPWSRLWMFVVSEDS